MPTTRHRRKLQPAPFAIPEAAAEAWRCGDFHGLNRALGIMPHQISPFDADREGPPFPNPLTEASWPRALELRRKLIALAGVPRRHDRHGRPLGR